MAIKTETTKTALDELESLEAEAATIAAAIRDAAEIADGEKLHELKTRANVLHTLIPTARLRVAKERLAAMLAKQEQTVGKGDSQKTAAAQEHEAAVAVLATAQARVNEARQKLSQLQGTQQFLMHDIAQARRDVAAQQHAVANSAQSLSVRNLGTV